MLFSDFFQKWLYENYYKNGVFVGKRGDFYTAVSVGELFGSLLAKHFLSLIDKQILTPPLQVVEIGANEGYLSRDFLSALVQFRPNIFEKLEFHIIEPHEKLQILQKQTLKGVEFTHHHSFKETHFQNAFIFCNELFDSFACDLIDNDKMAFIEDFKFIFKPLSPTLKKQCELLNLQKGEFSFYLSNFFEDLNAACDSFIFAGFDYGEFLPQRFSLRIYQNHQLFDPFEVDLRAFFGKSDLTYNVNFTHLQYLIEKYHFKLLSLEKQSKALLEFGLESIIEQSENKEKLLSQAKHLFFNFDAKFHFFEFQKSPL
ncbi:SAM-dependent methyltransferase [Campylobacter upsaliensis]|uniref:SAM-dependent methyltransferase n=1 Tax=Campylobacter upsaliensis TaxID=28080 RepID=UPI002B3DD518|nr:SAM-dependent methyltransferase [Campylobacter upsaliensis]MEB2811877.1 SAM-dependent methyltransferase [Campylobacter upsaliensis]MEB2822810.1 SAM-dependent methyltransferase [Campylobacter upsaliensis]